MEADHEAFKIITSSAKEINIGEAVSSKKWITEVKDLLAIPIQFIPPSKGYF
jgi:hypothetical protein